MNAEKKIIRAIVYLTIHDPVFACLAMLLARRPMPEEHRKLFEAARGFTPTMGTDGVNLFYNPEFVEKLDERDLIGVIVHEALHVAMKHVLRRGDRDIELWNIACDYAINPMVQQSGYRLPNGALLDNKYDNMSAEQIYELLRRQASGASPQQSAAAGMGAVFDCPELQDVASGKKTIQEIEDKINRAVQAAAQAAKQAGKLPKFIERVVEEARSVPIDYRELLRDWLSKSIYKNDYSWVMPNRRYAAHGVYLPGLAPEEDQVNILFLVDCSGSISNEDLGLFEEQIGHVLQMFKATYHVVYFDTCVQHTQDVDHTEMPIKLQAKGGGGTDFREAMAYAARYAEENDVQALLCFTDLATNDFGDPPGVPVLWMNHYRHNDNAQVPFGTIIPLFRIGEDNRRPA